MSSYKDLLVWTKAIDLCEDIYTITRNFPVKEQFGLTSQMTRCAVSIPSNIAEGQKRGSLKEYIQFLRISYGSCAELETQIIIANRIGYVNKTGYENLLEQITIISKMLNALIKKLSFSTKT